MAIYFKFQLCLVAKSAKEMAEPSLCIVEQQKF